MVTEIGTDLLNVVLDRFQILERAERIAYSRATIVSPDTISQCACGIPATVYAALGSVGEGSFPTQDFTFTLEPECCLLQELHVTF